jgi:hypothetical protein
MNEPQYKFLARCLKGTVPRYPEKSKFVTGNIYEGDFYNNKHPMDLPGYRVYDDTGTACWLWDRDTSFHAYFKIVRGFNVQL